MEKLSISTAMFNSKLLYKLPEGKIHWIPWKIPFEIPWKWLSPLQSLEITIVMIIVILSNNAIEHHYNYIMKSISIPLNHDMTIDLLIIKSVYL